MSKNPKTQTLKIGNLVATSVDRSATPPADAEKREQFIRGATRLRASGASLEKLTGLHAAAVEVEAELATPATDHGTPAAARAGKRLWATLGADCFASVEEATAWARRSLPLSAAHAQAKADADRRMNASRAHHVAKAAFWGAAEEEAKRIALFTRHTLDVGRMVDEVLQHGVE